MTPTEAQTVADDLIDSAPRSATEIRQLVRALPYGTVPAVVEALVHRAHRAINLLENPPAPDEWAPGDVRKAHTRYSRGLRDPWTRAGERVYQRDKKRKYAAARRDNPQRLQAILHDRRAKEIDGGVCNSFPEGHLQERGA